MSATPLLDRIAKRTPVPVQPKNRPLPSKPIWVQRAEEVGHVVKEFQS